MSFSRDYPMEKEVNKWLADYFPHYRLVWGPDQKEKRFGTFTKTYPIYCQVTEIREVDKYPMLNVSCYVLETKAYYSGDEIKNHNGWDICFPFIDMLGKAAMPTLETIQFMMKELINHEGKVTTTPGEAKKQDQERFDREVQAIEERLSE